MGNIPQWGQRVFGSPSYFKTQAAFCLTCTYCDPKAQRHDIYKHTHHKHHTLQLKGKHHRSWHNMALTGRAWTHLLQADQRSPEGWPRAGKCPHPAQRRDRTHPRPGPSRWFWNPGCPPPQTLLLLELFPTILEVSTPHSHHPQSRGAPRGKWAEEETHRRAGPWRGNQERGLKGGGKLDVYPFSLWILYLEQVLPNLKIVAKWNQHLQMWRDLPIPRPVLVVSLSPYLGNYFLLFVLFI